MTTMRSSLLPAFMRRTLWRGTLLAGMGVFILLFGGIFIPVGEMTRWGPLLFMGSLALIAWGLLPYRRLKRLEENPYTLTIEGLEWLHFSVKGKPLLSIPFSSIDHLSYIEKGNIYGIGVFLKNPLPKKLAVQNSGFDLTDFRKQSLGNYGCDLFLQYFSQRSFNSLQEHFA